MSTASGGGTTLTITAGDDIACDPSDGNYNGGAGSPQEQWLRTDLSAHPAACTLAYWHHSRYSSANHGSNTSVTALWQALVNGGADVVLSGHDHDYERFAPQDAHGVLDTVHGVVQFVVGTGGKTHYSIPSTITNSRAHDNNTCGMLRLTLKPTSYDW